MAPLRLRRLRVPLVLAVAYLGLLVARFPALIRWEGTHGDYASAFVLADAISAGHTGAVVMSTQGAWIALGFGLLTHALSFHRVLWELAPTLLTVVWVCLIGVTVSRVASRAAGALTVALIAAASPTGVISLTAPWAHNTTLPAAALLGGFLVWLHRRPHRTRTLAATALALSVVVGACLASDGLLWTEGLIPFVLVALVSALLTRSWRPAAPVAAVAGGAIAVATVLSHTMRSLGFTTTTPPLELRLGLIGLHLSWLTEGLLRMGNGWAFAPQAAWRAPLTAAAALVTVAALALTARLAARSLTEVRDRLTRARAIHVLFWTASLLCAAGAYVATAEVPSDRYVLVAIPAIAATVPLALGGGGATRRVAIGASVFIAASIVALAVGDVRYGTERGIVARQAGPLEALVAGHHLGVGYAGYWDAAPLDWTSHERLHVYPVTDAYGPLVPMVIARDAAWYRPRRTASYLFIAPGDNTLADRRPPGLPAPAHVYRLGLATVLAYRYDIARDLHAPVN